MAKIKKIKETSFSAKIEGINVVCFTTKAKNLIEWGYVASRGVNDEPGAVQRLFSKKRVTEIAEYVSDGGGFFSPFILNWKDKDNAVSLGRNEITLPLLPDTAQLLDGQHRFRGIQEAVKNLKYKADKDVLVVLVDNLTTKDAAKIFTNINSKQKTVAKSLIYDLFTELGYAPDHEINRANDIAIALNQNKNSPYFGRIKFPGAPGHSGMIELATVVDSLKDHLGKDGIFKQKNIETLEHQTLVVINFFSVIRDSYEDVGLWEAVKKNPFLGSAGFRAGVNVLASPIINECSVKKSFTRSTFEKILSLDNEDLLTKDDENFRALSGKEQVKAISGFLIGSYEGLAPSEEDYEFE